MNNTQLVSFRNKIEIEIAALADKMKIQFPDTVSGRERISDENDQASAILEKDIEIMLKDRERIRFRLLSKALSRIENGSFGIREECRSTIPEKRLELNLIASHCIKCQERAERNI